jgi:8-oxo-dGTP diphosphatase
MAIKQTSIVAGVVLKRDGKFLLVQEKLPKAYKLWNLPAGKVEEGYSIEETAIKEAKEESGFDCKLIKLIDIYQEDAERPVRHAFFAEITGGSLQIPEDEILDAKWLSLEEIRDMSKSKSLRGEWVLDCIEKLENSSSS